MMYINQQATELAKRCFYTAEDVRSALLAGMTEEQILSVAKVGAPLRDAVDVFQRCGPKPEPLTFKELQGAIFEAFCPWAAKADRRYRVKVTGANGRVTYGDEMTPERFSRFVASQAGGNRGGIPDLSEQPWMYPAPGPWCVRNHIYELVDAAEAEKATAPSQLDALTAQKLAADIVEHQRSLRAHRPDPTPVAAPEGPDAVEAGQIWVDNQRLLGGGAGEPVHAVEYNTARFPSGWNAHAPSMLDPANGWRCIGYEFLDGRRVMVGERWNLRCIGGRIVECRAARIAPDAIVEMERLDDVPGHLEPTVQSLFHPECWWVRVTEPTTLQQLEAVGQQMGKAVTALSKTVDEATKLAKNGITSVAVDRAGNVSAVSFEEPLAQEPVGGTGQIKYRFEAKTGDTSEVLRALRDVAAAAVHRVEEHKARRERLRTLSRLLDGLDSPKVAREFSRQRVDAAIAAYRGPFAHAVGAGLRGACERCEPTEQEIAGALAAFEVLASYPFPKHPNVRVINRAHCYALEHGYQRVAGTQAACNWDDAAINAYLGARFRDELERVR